MLSPSSTYSELGGQDGDLSSWREEVGGRQLEWLGTSHICQHGAGDLLSIVVPWHVLRGWPMRSCTLVNTLGTPTVPRPRLLTGCRGKDVLGKFSRQISNFNCFFTLTYKFNALLHA
jgi:hypothetical protein